ncbi:MAG: alpha-D-glucose phosphate-specific phosphoglucomutase [Proteobacteria bacterium]|jgi:phosphoglucomutase|nr:alpha-D-glucose phosphate-specific phosphoglucomutase [Pseudomonadota bacterium]
MPNSPLAGQPATALPLLDVSRLLAAYFDSRPDPGVATQRVAFGTSGHRGTAFKSSFNEWHVLAITQAVCDYRQGKGIDGPVFIGIDTHALSKPAGDSALEVLAANGVNTMLAAGDEYTPTPVLSHAILGYNRGRSTGLADGLVMSPSHNPPDNGGYKYNPPNGGPADTDVTKWVENRANELLAAGLAGVKRMPLEQARRAATTHRHDYLNAYVADLGNVIDLAAIRAAGVRMAVDPLGGAGVHFWEPIAERYGIDLKVLNTKVDGTFSFMSLDWDGQVRMDPSSPHAMRSLLSLRDQYPIVMACDTDHDRHGIVAGSVGLMPPNHYLAVMIDYLYRNRPGWRADAAVGKTIVSSSIIDRVAADLGRKLFEVPVGFKWFVEGLISGSLGFVGEESAGATFLRRDGGAWATDKDGLIPGLLAGEMMAKTGRDPGELYAQLTSKHGESFYERIDAAATPAEKKKLGALSAEQVKLSSMAGEAITAIQTHAPGNGAAIGGLKVSTRNGWFAARPSGTEDVYKIYAESLTSAAHLKAIQQEAQAIVGAALR